MTVTGSFSRVSSAIGVTQHSFEYSSRNHLQYKLGKKLGVTRDIGDGDGHKTSYSFYPCLRVGISSI